MGDSTATNTRWLSSLETARKCREYMRLVPMIPVASDKGRAGAHANARMRLLKRSCSLGDTVKWLGSSSQSLKCSASASLMMNRRDQLDSSCGLPSADQIERVRFAVRTPRAHFRCFASPCGDHAMLRGELLDISSPIE